CALARDPVLRSTAPLVVRASPGDELTLAALEHAIEEHFPGTYKESTLRTARGNIASSWTQSGHLCVARGSKGSRKVRAVAEATPAAGAYALMLGYLEGHRGQRLFDTLWVDVLDRARSQLIDLASSAAQRGFLEFRHAGGVTEVGFRELLRP